MNILITGTTSGIGQSLLDDLSRDHDCMSIVRNPTGRGVGVEKVIPLDKNEIRKEGFSEILETGTSFDALILNAGVGYFWRHSSITEEQRREMLETNLIANIDLVETLSPLLHRWTTLIFIGSRAARKFLRDGAVYQASKFGLRGYAGALSREHPEWRIHFINPSIVDTNFFRYGPLSGSEKLPRTELHTITRLIRDILEGGKYPFEIDC